MTDKIKEIKYIQGEDSYTLGALLSDAINEGWQPYGSVAFTEEGKMVQAVVKYDTQTVILG